MGQVIAVLDALRDIEAARPVESEERAVVSACLSALAEDASLGVLRTLAGQASGPALLAAQEGTAPDVILLDIEMPVMDGFVVCEKLRKDDAVKHIPIVVLTATNNPKLNEKAFKAGADIVTLKVLSTERLVNMIRLAIGKGKAAPPV